MNYKQHSFFLSLLGFILSHQLLFAQDGQRNIFGYVKDNDGEAIIGAHVRIQGTSTGVSTNNYGYYSLKIPSGQTLISISSLGFQTKEEQIEVSISELRKDFFLQPATLQLAEVEIRADAIDLEQPTLGLHEVSMEQLRAISPQLLGEMDVIKGIQLLPGIQGGTENSTTFFVRGGDAGQNLILLDGIPVYNTAHLFGFLSVFNPDAIKNIKVMKGAFPAQYSGRLSSVTDIQMKEGNTERLAISGDIGVISSKLTLDGPLSDRFTFMASVRLTPLNLIFDGVQRLTSKSLNSLFFYDINAKLAYQLSAKDHLYFSLYNGLDQTAIKSDGFEQNKEQNTNFKWGNLTSSLRWTRAIKPRLFLNMQGYYSTYALSSDVTSVLNLSDAKEEMEYHIESSYTSSVKDLALKANIDYYLNPKHFVIGGWKYHYRTYSPNAVKKTTIETSENSSENQGYINDQFSSHELSFFIQDQIKLTSFLTLQMGLNQSIYAIDDTSFFSLQPRVALAIHPQIPLSFKLGYSKMQQHEHLLTSANSGVPTDIWIPANASFLPEKAHQWDVGVTTTILPSWKLSVETYYKKLENTLRFMEASDFLSTFLEVGPAAAATEIEQENWQESVIVGEGSAYGLEVSLEKKKGKLQGNFSYTWSYADRKYEQLNDAKPFPFRYNRTHDVFIHLNYSPNPKIRMNTSWVYQSGYRISVPTSVYDGYSNINYSPITPNHSSYLKPLYHYSQINNYVTPAYHRLDISCQFIKQKGTHRSRTWSVGIYNAYNRKNPYLIENNGNQLSMTSIFQILPFISYQFKL